MLTKVEVKPGQGTLLTLPLGDASGGYVIKDIDGLDPVKATFVSSNNAQLPGATFQSSSRETRNIVMKVGLEPDFGVTTVKKLRTNLYGFLMPETPVELHLYDDEGLVVNINGRVESFETPLFVKEPEVNISIVCFDPDFVEPNPILMSGMSTSGSTETLIPYKGTVDSGVQFYLNLNRPLTTFTIYHRAPDNVIQALEFSASLISGDVLYISTVNGDKGAKLTRAGSSSSLLYGVSSQSVWVQLKKNGDNYIRVSASGAGIPFDLKYVNRYGGL